jgi:diguanylate cyclase (GGDEF)-like protein
MEIAEKIRKRTQEHDFLYEDKNIKITSSFGVYTVFCRDTTIDKLIAAADKNLYTAKQTGRNRVAATSDI